MSVPSTGTPISNVKTTKVETWTVTSEVFDHLKFASEGTLKAEARLGASPVSLTLEELQGAVLANQELARRSVNRDQWCDTLSIGDFVKTDEAFREEYLKRKKADKLEIAYPEPVRALPSTASFGTTHDGFAQIRYSTALTPLAREAAERQAAAFPRWGGEANTARIVAEIKAQRAAQQAQGVSGAVGR